MPSCCQPLTKTNDVGGRREVIDNRRVTGAERARERKKEGEREREGGGEREEEEGVFTINR